MYKITSEVLSPLAADPDDVREIVKQAVGEEACESYYDTDPRLQRYSQAVVESHAHNVAIDILGSVLRLAGVVANHMSMTMWNMALKMSGPVGASYGNDAAVSGESLHQSASDIRQRTDELMDALGVEFEDAFDVDLGLLMVQLASGQVMFQQVKHDGTERE